MMNEMMRIRVFYIDWNFEAVGGLSTPLIYRNMLCNVW